MSKTHTIFTSYNLLYFYIIMHFNMSIKHELKSMIISVIQKESDDSCAEPLHTRTLKTKPEMLYMWLQLCSDWIWFGWATSNYSQPAERTCSNPELSADGDRHGGLFHIHHSNCISWILKLKNMVLIHSPRESPAK